MTPQVSGAAMALTSVFFLRFSVSEQGRSSAFFFSHVRRHYTHHASIHWAWIASHHTACSVQLHTQHRTTTNTSLINFADFPLPLEDFHVDISGTLLYSWEKLAYFISKIAENVNFTYELAFFFFFLPIQKIYKSIFENTDKHHAVRHKCSQTT